MSENIVLIIVLCLSFVVLVLVGVIVYLFKETLKAKDTTATTNEASVSKEPEVVGPTDLEVLKKQQETFQEEELNYCANHPQDHAVGICAICQDSFCEECVKEHDGISFCSAHFRFFLNNEWVEMKSIKTTPDTPETAMPLYDFKRGLWEKEGTASIISTHYKINIEGDSIESYVKLLVREDDLRPLSEKFEKLYQ